ncbi:MULTISPECIES: DUF805 domain-containing protein [Haematobacter]|uniref:DUF805 domain-containing protein n=1 Tax=Haematobacter genomosp. 1 TaxID=366618 RepID=A0A212AEN6_9RHOB|nr:MULTISPECIES: DUF805 domain-containing protein [Haematobacter]OWJ79875.1 DUF805 domain-containing protein [Haematobacter genomosp. 1]
MGFAEAVRSCLRQYVGFRGRAPRSEYWWFVLALTIAGMVASLIDAMLFGATVSTGVATSTPPPPVEGYGASAWATAENGPVSSLLGLLVFLPHLAVMIRRLHDTNRSGWYVLAPFAIVVIGLLAIAALFNIAPTLAGLAWFVMFIAAVFLPLYWLIQRGTAGQNRFGPDPLEVRQ